MNIKLFIIFVSILFIISCAHVSNVKENGEFSKESQVQTAINVDNEGIEDEFLDENLDFLDEEDEEYDNNTVYIYDPLYYYNKTIFVFNDKLFFWVVKPVCKGYKAVVPNVIRQSVRNFFINIAAPVRIISCFLQSKPEAAGNEIGRFLLNTTAGGLGFFDPAKNDPRLVFNDENMKQTLAVFGVGNGFYIVWPFFGPSSLRDSIGSVFDLYLDPVPYIDFVTVRTGAFCIYYLNEASFQIDDYEALIEASFEPYEALRSAYVQNRNKKNKE